MTFVRDGPDEEGADTLTVAYLILVRGKLVIRYERGDTVGFSKM